jgi:hypothetical protein
MRAKLSRTSQGWILSGEKTFITLRLEWGDISCPFMTSYGLSLREAPWSAVAAATAFLALALARLRYESIAEGA